MLAAKAAETQRRSITMSFPSVARSSLNLLRGLVSSLYPGRRRSGSYRGSLRATWPMPTGCCCRSSAPAMTRVWSARANATCSDRSALSIGVYRYREARTAPSPRRASTLALPALPRHRPKLRSQGTRAMRSPVSPGVRDLRSGIYPSDGRHERQASFRRIARRLQRKRKALAVKLLCCRLAVRQKTCQRILLCRSDPT